MDPELRSELVNTLKAFATPVVAALTDIPVPIYVLDKDGVLVWGNIAAVTAFGDLRNVHYLTIVAPEYRDSARNYFARQIVGAQTAEFETVVVAADGKRYRVDVDSVRLEDEGRVIGVFGIAEIEQPVDEVAASEVPLTPRQLEVLTLLAGGCSTETIAKRLHISKETVRNHVRHILRALGVHSRIQAVARARELGIL
jgi:PAS domain S-box-containing protein